MTLTQRDREFIQYSRKVEEQRILKGFSQQKVLHNYRTSFFIYKDNLISLKKVLVNYYEILDSLTEKDVKRWHIQRNIIRNLHNVISSSKTFIDYLNVSKRKQGFCELFENKIETVFRQSELHNFMHLLRNYVIHIHCLPLISRRELKRNNDNIEKADYESFDKQKLTEYLITLKKKKNSFNFDLVKSYLEKSPKYINLVEVLIKYDKILSEFYEWFVMSFIIHNKSNIMELIKLNTKFREFARSKNLNTENPLNKAQLRYLKYLINKFNE